MIPTVYTSFCEHFKLQKVPFLNRSKQAFNYEQFEQNLMYISTVFYSRQIAVISGASGSGKSSLIFYALNALEPSEFRVVGCELANPNKKALYKTLAVNIGLDPAHLADDIKLQIINFFHEENAQGKFNCVIIDEAHTLSIPMIDELRSFYEEGNNFSLILSGLPVLVKKNLNLTVTLPMKQRVALFLECEGLSLHETQKYVDFQFEQAQAKHPILDECCFPLLHSTASGLPRKINQLCYGTLLEAFKEKKAIVTEELFQKVIEKLSYS